METITFSFSGELPKDWKLSFEELKLFLKDLPIDPQHSRGEMLSVYEDGVPTKDLSCRGIESGIESCVGGDKDRLIWAKWRLAVAEAIAFKYDKKLCGVYCDGGNFTLKELFSEEIQED